MTKKRLQQHRALKKKKLKEAQNETIHKRPNNRDK